MQVQWINPSNGGFYLLHAVDLEHSHFDNLQGVYVIFNNVETLDVGIGNIRSRLYAHRTQFEHRDDYKELRVRWAAVAPNSQGGVENYLADKLNLTVGQRFSNNPPIEVNLPW